jgi:hypothetical protein
MLRIHTRSDTYLNVSGGVTVYSPLAAGSGFTSNAIAAPFQSAVTAVYQPSASSSPSGGADISNDTVASVKKAMSLSIPTPAGRQAPAAGNLPRWLRRSQSRRTRPTSPPTAPTAITPPQNYFSTSEITNGNLHALSSALSGGNGVYAYGASGLFQTGRFSSSNSYVDVAFRPQQAA